MGHSPLPQRGGAPSQILGVGVENFEIGPEVRGTSANFVALEQQIILEKTRSESV